MVEVERVDHDARNPVETNEACQSEGGPIPAQKLAVESEGQGAKRNDCEDRQYMWTNFVDLGAGGNFVGTLDGAVWKQPEPEKKNRRDNPGGLQSGSSSRLCPCPRRAP